MPNDRLANTLGLSLGGPKLLQNLQSLESTLKLETHKRCLAVLLRRADIVVQAGQRPSFEETLAHGRGGNPGGEVLGYDGVAVGVDAEGVVVGFLWEEGEGVGLGFLDERGGGPNGGDVDGGGGCFGGGGGGDGASVAGDGGPAVGFCFLLGLGHCWFVGLGVMGLMRVDWVFFRWKK